MIAGDINRPLLRYFGGKWQLRQWIISMLPEHQYYVEPFAGAASILLSKKPAPKAEVINDICSDIFNLFQVLRDDKLSPILLEKLKLTLFSFDELKLAQQPSDDSVERARRLIVKSMMSIGIAGTSKTGTGIRLGNSTLEIKNDTRPNFRNGGKEWSSYVDQLQSIIVRLRTVMVFNESALKFMKKYDNPDCLIYLDPPYAHETRSDTRYVNEFGAEEQREMVDIILQTKSMVVLSGYQTDVYWPLEEAGYEVFTKNATSLAGDKRTEYLWVSPNALGHRQLKINF